MPLFRAALFFLPHLALVVLALHGEQRAFIAVSALLPWWSRFVGKPWPLDRRFLLGPAVAVAGYVALAMSVVFEDVMLAASILVGTLFFALYAFFVFEWKRKG
jgi:hypothetical protein